MARQITILALIFFAAVGMAAATPSTPASLAPAASADESNSNVIGTISGGTTASDAAPVGGPVPDNVFPNLTPAPAPPNGAAALEATTVAGVIAAAGIVGSFFF